MEQQLSDIEKSIFIECDCGTHHLKVTSLVEYHGNRFSQDIYLAMFYYGIHSHKRNIWDRLIIAWKYLRTGKMHSDQIILNPDEANKLLNFINENLI